MVWTIEQRGALISVAIEPPVEDWEKILDGLLEAITPGIVAVGLPLLIEGGSDFDAKQLQRLWTIVHARNLAIPPSLEIDGSAPSTQT